MFETTIWMVGLFFLLACAAGAMTMYLESLNELHIIGSFSIAEDEDGNLYISEVGGYRGWYPLEEVED